MEKIISLLLLFSAVARSVRPARKNEVVKFIDSEDESKFRFKKLEILVILGFLSIVLVLFLLRFGLIDGYKLSIITVSLASTILLAQGIFTLLWMLYAWDNPSAIEKNLSPQKYSDPRYSFTALVPVRFEERVVHDTLKAVARINYPEELKEVLVICRHDDRATLSKVQRLINKLDNKNIRLLVSVDSYPINKPKSLNFGLKEARNEIITIFDAEDEPHSDIYNIINTVLLRDKVDVVQSGVQLMNYRSNWFSTLNVLEYFFWFKSGLHFFTNIGKVSPLGGNTVFFKKNWLKKVGGWDDSCLTEDADVGIRLTLAGAKTRVVYDERHSTREETPSTVEGFIKQRTRWVQGFLQIMFKGDWLKLPSLRQRIVAGYVLSAPIIPAFLIIYMPIGIWIGATQSLPFMLTLMSFIPSYIIVILVAVQIVGLWEFTRAYKLKFPIYMPIKIAFTFLPYAFMMSFASARAVYRMLTNLNSWEKTLHLNAHRQIKAVKS
jgi:cellulose synthase/poly-beta-1,6-N-acetylglucosamine synthase-like glycosyltransferase